MVPLLCSGLTILSKYEIKNQYLIDLDVGNGSTDTIFDLYFEHLARRQAMFTDIKVEVNCFDFFLN